MDLDYRNNFYYMHVQYCAFTINFAQFVYWDRVLVSSRERCSAADLFVDEHSYSRMLIHRSPTLWEYSKYFISAIFLFLVNCKDFLVFSRIICRICLWFHPAVITLIHEKTFFFFLSWDSVECCLWWFYIISPRLPTIRFQRLEWAGSPALELPLRPAMWQNTGLTRNPTWQELFSSLPGACAPLKPTGPRVRGQKGMTELMALCAASDIQMNEWICFYHGVIHNMPSAHVYCGSDSETLHIDNNNEVHKWGIINN